MNIYEPLPLVSNEKYIGYKIGFYIKSRNKNSNETFEYVVSTITAWLNKKLQTKDKVKCFECKHFDNGYRVDISYRKQDSAWALQIKEPDVLKTLGRPNIVGRYFLTEVAVKNTGDGVKIQCIITVLDPPNVDEVDYAFRPAFIRTFVADENLIMYQIDESFPISQNVINVDSDDTFERFAKLYNSGENTIPIIVFSENDEKIPFDVSELASHMFGYAHVVTIKSDYIQKMQGLCGLKMLKPETIFRLSPRFSRKYSPNCKYDFDDSYDEKTLSELLHFDEVNGRIDAYGTIPSDIRSWFKRKEPKTLDVLFFKQIDKKLREDEIENYKANKDYQTAYERLLEDYLELKEENEDLRTEIEQARENGGDEVMNALIDLENKFDRVKEEKNSLSEENITLVKKIKNLENEVVSLNAQIEAMGRRPHKKEELIEWAEKEYEGKILIHSKAKKSYDDAYIDRDKLTQLCDCIDFLANDYRDYRLHEIDEQEYQKRAQTKYNRLFKVEPNSEDLIKQFASYRIKYEQSVKGKPKETPLDQHLKIGVDSENLVRIYFLFDADKKLIVIGNMPKHLETMDRTH